MSRRSQLFVGRLPLDSRERDIEDIFDRYGSMVRCDLKFGTGMAYAFVDYEDKRDAEDAIKYENGRKIRGQTIVVEWARGPNSRPMMRKANAECYRCHRTGHWARDCPELERDRYSSRRYRSRSRSHSYTRRNRANDEKGARHNRRSPSRSPGYYYRGRRRWRTPSQTRSPSYNRSRRPVKKRTPSRSTSRSRSRSGSPSKDKMAKGGRTPSKSPSRSPRRSHSRSISKEHSRSHSKPKSRSHSLQKEQSQSPRKSLSRSRSRSSEGRKHKPRKGRSSSRESNAKDDVYNGDQNSDSKHSRDRSVSPAREKSRSRSHSSDRQGSEGRSD